MRDFAKRLAYTFVLVLAGVAERPDRAARIRIDVRMVILPRCRR